MYVFQMASLLLAAGVGVAAACVLRKVVDFALVFKVVAARFFLSCTVTTVDAITVETTVSVCTDVVTVVTLLFLYQLARSQYKGKSHMV